jgi:hypothetical protein
MPDTYMDSIDHMEIAALRELQDAVRIRRINIELFEYLCASIRWTLRYAKNNRINLPDIDKFDEILERAANIDEKTPI